MVDARAAIRAGSIPRLTKILRQHPRLVNGKNTRGFTLLDLAVRRSNLKMVELLANFGCTILSKPNVQDETPIFQAATIGNHQLIELLVRLGAQNIDYNYDFVSPLEIAIIDEKHECIHTLRCLGARKITFERKAHRDLPPLEDDEVIEVRRRVYFSESLLDRLFRADSIASWIGRDVHKRL